MGKSQVMTIKRLNKKIESMNEVIDDIINENNKLKNGDKVVSDVVSQSDNLMIKNLFKKIRSLNGIIDETIGENIQLEHEIAKLNDDIYDLKQSHKKEIKKLQLKINELEDVSNMKKVIQRLEDKEKELEIENEKMKIAQYDLKYQYSDAWSLSRIGVFDE